jgi:Flp pilus assembly protein TadD
MLAAGVIVVAGLAAYANSVWGPFIYDDLGSILDNPTIRQLWPLSQPLSPPCDTRSVTSRPVLNLSLAVNYYLGGKNVWGYHATNVAIHLVNGLLLLGVLWRTFQLPALKACYGQAGWGAAMAIALLWTVHPLQTESVTYIVQRAESLAGLFYLLTLYSAIRGVASSHGAWWHSVAIGACWLGVGVKEIVVTAPVVVLLYDRTFLEDSFRKIFRRRWGLYVGLFGSWGLQIGLLARTGISMLTKEVGTVGMWAYARSQPGVILHYLRLSFWPDRLCLSYEWPVAHTMGEILPGMVVVGVLVAATIWGLREWRGWAFLGAWFFVTLAPSSSILPVPHLAFEHRMYLPLASIVTLAVTGGCQVGQRLVRGGWISRWLCLAVEAGLVMLMAMVLAVLTSRRNEVYQSPLSLWEDTVAKAPYNPDARNNLGIALGEAGRIAEAIEHFQQAIRLKPDDAGSYNNLGLALASSGRQPEAIEQYQHAIRLKPGYATAHNNLGNSLLNCGRVPEAIDHYQEAVRLKPDDAAAYNNLGLAMIKSGRLSEAIEQYHMLLRLEPGLPEAHYNVALALARTDRLLEAIAHLQQALRLRPDYPEAQHNLILALSHGGRVREAVDLALEVVKQAPEQPQVHHFVAWLIATHEPTDGVAPATAVELAQRACILAGQRDIDYLDTLAAAYASAGRFNEAVTTAKEAWQMAQSAGQNSLAEEIHMRLQLYRDRKPYRQPAVPPASLRP